MIENFRMCSLLCRSEILLSQLKRVTQYLLNHSLVQWLLRFGPLFCWNTKPRLRYGRDIEAYCLQETSNSKWRVFRLISLEEIRGRLRQSSLWCLHDVSLHYHEDSRLRDDELLLKLREQQSLMTIWNVVVKNYIESLTMLVFSMSIL